jgi:hypothetical protein
MSRTIDILLTALAPAVWGSTYIVATELLPAGYPLRVAMLRALPAGLLLLVLVRTLPQGIWWLRVTVAVTIAWCASIEERRDADAWRVDDVDGLDADARTDMVPLPQPRSSASSLWSHRQASAWCRWPRL